MPIPAAAGVAKADHLSVRGGVAGLDALIVSERDDDSLGGQERGSDRDAPLAMALEGLLISGFHGELIEFGLLHAGIVASPRRARRLRYPVLMASEYAPGVIVFDHPLIQHKLTHLRDHTVTHRPFRALLYQIAGLMVYEITRELPARTIDVQTPLETTRGQRLAAKITVVPVLRAGLGMAEGIMEMMPEARIGHLGLVRNEKTLEPTVYLKRLPRDLDAGPVILVDPMLATGGSASQAVSILRDAGARDLRMICLVAAPEGIARMRKDHPDLTIYTAAVDRQLNEKGYIVPGLGDAGDRMYGTE